MTNTLRHLQTRLALKMDLLTDLIKLKMKFKIINLKACSFS